MSEVSTRFEDLAQEQQTFLVDFLNQNFSPISSINRKHSAYGLKQRFTSRYFYVTQEQFTEGMRRAGYTVQPLEGGNARFNISERSPFFKRP